MQRILWLLVLAGSLLSLQAQESKAVQGTFALTNARIETVSQGVVNGTLVIRNGKIEALGANVKAPADAKVIDCTGKTIYPGFIDGGTQVGLYEVGSIEVTIDDAEVGDFTPHMQALTAVNPNSVVIPVTRVNGVTTVLTMPSGNVLPGSAALISLHGYTPEQMYAGFKGLVLEFPTTARPGRFDTRSEEDLKKDTEKRLKKLNDIWDEARQYAKIDSAFRAGGGEAPAYYPEMAALVPAVLGQATVLIEVNVSSDIEAAIKWVEEHKVKAVFTGVSEGWRVADKLAKARIPVITGPVLGLPTREYDRYDKAYANAGLMLKAGVKVALRTNEARNVRNLPFHAGFAAAYGMGQEAALRAITLTPAEIFGVADRMGSLEVGKDATLIVASGDPFEPKTQISEVFIRGWKMPLDNRQTRLNDEFLQRDPGVKK
ncbi:MAG: amidohydrolase [Bacteroidetes bacterium]|nr:MAG: amidohydrolase [Bacteroidota bacterium]